MESLSAAHSQFSIKLFKEISEGNASGNVFYSPLSIFSALAMLTAGAAGNTQAQIFKVLGIKNSVKANTTTPAPGPSVQKHAQKPQKLPAGLTKPPPQLHKEPVHKTEDNINSNINKLMSELNKPGVPYMLSLVNRLYGEQSYQFVDKFIKDTEKYYQAGLEKVDFKTNAKAARDNINKWVEKNTQGKIKNLLPEGTVDGMTKLVLVNAIYFKGTWMLKFKKEFTRELQFKLNKAQTKAVQMMHQTDRFPLALIPEVNCQVLELPYIGETLSMLIILPNKIEDDTTGLQKLEKAMTYEKLMEWTGPERMSEQKVKIALPKFKMAETYDMNSLLKAMGMVDAFDTQKVNLSGMCLNNDLVVSKVIHKSFVEVNEAGTEAAAATAVVCMLGCALGSPLPTFIADHPFLFFIRHNPTKSILFYGRFCSP
ncbi:leukocyte elastase inhibitor-like [Xyrauchen texanus]|uniref:leukocyte elastase inhibitor-like n=1 Tax=Xyrauchen texanus TaxID=154827 RepID=UPI002242912B|nr:leukocyte elastase inhibitor-like [Xyrauchen texanus]XP_052002582.1 leukocyte elastase inhibitor-like [Xyrauchen texanus]XP_052002583.1 leukocyte elastase inhibitor-like [Xyrauchen texanus]